MFQLLYFAIIMVITTTSVAGTTTYITIRKYGDGPLGKNLVLVADNITFTN